MRGHLKPRNLPRPIKLFVLATVVALIVMAINPLLGLIALVAVFVIAEIIARTVQIKALRRRLRETS